DVAQLVHELTGVERVAFCNSGTEAVMSALRIARAVTRRRRVALFTGAYHGTFDGVLVRPERDPSGVLRARPPAPGVADGLLEDRLLLDADDPASLEALRAHGHELAAVLIEPMNSRRPGVDPRPFLEALRSATNETQTALVFDEVVSGFRMHAGGA